MKNICFLNTTNFWGGGEKIHFDYAMKFKERGYNVFIVADGENELFKKASENGINTFDFSLKNLSFLNPLKYLKLKGFYERNEIDTVIISTSHDTKVGTFAANAAGVERIVLYRALAAPVKNRLLNRIIYKKIFTHLIVNSFETKRLVLENIGSLQKEDIQIIYQGLEFDKIEAAKVKKHHFGENKIIIGNVGRLTKQKGQYYFIEIAKQLKEQGLAFKIVIAGSGELEKSLQNKIAAQELENHIELLGFVEDVNSFMHSIDIFALTSEWEGFGYVIAEAMIAKKPVVAFDITSNPELVKDNKNGYLVPFKDTKSFASKVLDLANNSDLRNKMGEWGSNFVKQEFQLDHIIDQFEEKLTQ